MQDPKNDEQPKEDKANWGDTTEIEFRNMQDSPKSALSEDILEEAKGNIENEIF